MFNEVTLIGNVGNPPEVKIVKGGNSKVANFTFATNEGYYNDKNEWVQQTEWHRIIAWNKLADRCEKIEKGQQLFIKGRISYRTYDDDKGVKHYVTEIVAQVIRALGVKKDGDPGPRYQSPTNSGGQNKYKDPPPNNDEEDDLPF